MVRPYPLALADCSLVRHCDQIELSYSQFHQASVGVSSGFPEAWRNLHRQREQQSLLPVVQHQSNQPGTHRLIGVQALSHRRTTYHSHRTSPNLRHPRKPRLLLGG